MIAGLPRCLISARAQRMAKRRQRQLPKRRLQLNSGLKQRLKTTCLSPNPDTGQSNTQRRDATMELLLFDSASYLNSEEAIFCYLERGALNVSHLRHPGLDPGSMPQHLCEA
jgi:hypothetical protein